MMRSASFFILSVSLHVAALAYPVSFGGRSQANLIQVTILPLEQEGGAGGQGGNGSPTAPRDEESHRARPSAMEPRVDPKPPANPELEVLSANNVATANDSSITLVSAIANSAETLGPVIPGTDTNRSGNGLGETGSGNGSGSPGSGVGPGRGDASGTGSSGTGIALTPASYRDTPRPAYPESARRAGREGRVLLRVLVDDQGGIKQLEINHSSGSDALDRAAAEAIKRWRFHPARYGDKSVESWLRIPIEFRLADAKP
jgi:protein TonB